MNKRNEWEELLEQANGDLKKYSIWMKISEEDGFFTLYLMQVGKLPYTFAENCDENELCELINEAWAHARAKGKHEKLHEENKITALSTKMHLLCETIQEITLVTWPVIWADNKYDQDSRVVLETIREWGWAFESWWLGHTEEWLDDHDYIEEVEKFAERKCKEYLEEIGVDQETRETKVFDETGHLIVTRTENATENKGHIEETIDIMLDIASIYEDMFAEEVCDRDVERTLTKEWGREFSKWWYCDLPDEERMNRDYIAELEAFVDKKVKELKEQQEHPAGVKEFIVHVTRTTTAELDLCVRAYREEDAVEQAETALGRHDVVAEAITARAKAKDYFKTHQAYATEEHIDFYI